MNTNRVGATLIAAALLLSAVATPALAQSASLSVTAAQERTGQVTVTVVDGGTVAENATVDVRVDGHGSYVGAGEYETDETGRVVLPAPAANVRVTVTAADGGETATTTADLTPPEPVGPFGRIVSTFVSALQDADFSGPLGQGISEFVTENAPSNDAARGPPAAGNSDPVSPPTDPENASENDNGSRVVPATPPVDTPGNAGSAPGQDDGADGNGTDTPGNAGSAPGQDDSDEDGGDSDEADGGNGDGDTGSNGNVGDGNAGGDNGR